MTSRTTLSLNKETIRVLSTTVSYDAMATTQDGPSVNTCPTTVQEPSPDERRQPPPPPDEPEEN